MTGRPAPDWSALRRVLAVRLDNIGDVVMLTPALRALRASLPEASLTLLCSRAGAQVYPLLPWIDQILERKVVWQDASGDMPQDPEREGEFIQQLAAGDYDAAFIFTSFSQSPYPPAYACYVAGIPLRVGQSKEFGGSVLSHPVPPHPDAGHQVDRNLHLLASVGIPVHGHHLELRVPEQDRASAAAALRSLGVHPEDGYVVLAPGASCSARRYPPHRYAEVARRLTAQSGLPVVVVGGPREAEVSAPVRAAGPGVVSLVGTTTVAELAAVVAGAALVVTNNSAPLHLADAFRRPCVVLYSGTEHESQFVPRHTPLRLLRRHTACSPCRAFTCPYDLECLDIPAGEVVDACLDLLAPSPHEEDLCPADFAS